MTAFVPSDIPSTVTTVEELAAWSASILAEVNYDTKIQTNVGTLEPVAQAQTYRFPAQQTSAERLVISIFLPLSSSWRGGGKLFGSGVSEISTTPIPAHYKTV